MGNTLEAQIRDLKLDNNRIRNETKKFNDLLKKERIQFKLNQQALQAKIIANQNKHKLAQDKINNKLKTDSERFSLIYKNMEEKLEMKKELVENVEREKIRIRKEFEVKAQNDKEYRETIKNEFDKITEVKQAEFKAKLLKEQKENDALLKSMDDLNKSMDDLNKSIEEQNDPANFAKLQRTNFDNFIMTLAKNRGLFDQSKYDSDDCNTINIGVVGSVSAGKTSFLRVLTETLIGIVNKGEATREISKLCSLLLDKLTNKFIRCDNVKNDLYKKYRDNSETSTCLTEGIKTTEQKDEIKQTIKTINIWDTPGLHDRKAYYTPEILSHFKSLDLVLVMYTTSPMTVLNVLLTLKAMLIPFILIKSKIDINNSGFDAFEDEESTPDETVKQDARDLEPHLGYAENIYKISSTNVYKNNVFRFKNSEKLEDEYDWTNIVNIIKHTT